MTVTTGTPQMYVIFRLTNYLPNPLTRRLSSICSRHQDISSCHATQQFSAVFILRVKQSKETLLELLDKTMKALRPFETSVIISRQGVTS